MTRYFFNIWEDGNVVYDLEGIDLEDDDAAETEAVVAAREILADKVRRGDAINGQRFEVIDGHGNLVLEMPFIAALNFA